MNILNLEPYYGGSHKAFADVLRNHSAHKIEIFSMPPRFWKWRLSGAPYLFAEDFEKLENDPDLLIFSNTIDVSAFVALAGPRAAKLLKVIYFHENQIAYPLSDQDTRDVHYGLINITSSLVCDEVWFNSHFHFRAFSEEIDPFMKQFPDFAPKGLADRIRKKIRVLPLPVEPLPESREHQVRRKKTGPLRILWNHRWEYDKDPESFFKALYRLAAEGIDFEVAVLGENFTRQPKVFDEARIKLGERVVCFGYQKSRQDYAEWVHSSDVVVSTAIQENFGVSVAEAVLAGCRPILPRRLVYPDFIPDSDQARFLYDTEDQLVGLLRDASRRLPELRDGRHYPFYDNCRAEKVVRVYDEVFFGLGG